MEIRELTEADIGLLVEFYADFALSEDEKDRERKIFQKDIKSALKTNHMLIALENERIVGFLWAHIHTDSSKKKVDKVKMLLISPERFGEGIGGELVEAEREFAKKEGVSLMDIDIR